MTHARAALTAALAQDLSRRRFLQTGVGGVLLLAFGAVLPTGCTRYSSTSRSLRFLNPKEFAVVTQAAVRILGLPEDDRERIGLFIDEVLAGLPSGSQLQARMMLRVVEHGTHLFDLKPKRFTRLSPDEQDHYLEGWMQSTLGARRVIFRALKTLAALGYYGQPGAWPAIDYAGPWIGRVEVAATYTHEAPVALARLLEERRGR